MQVALGMKGSDEKNRISIRRNRAREYFIDAIICVDNMSLMRSFIFKDDSIQLVPQIVAGILLGRVAGGNHHRGAPGGSGGSSFKRSDNKGPSSPVLFQYETDWPGVTSLFG